MVFSLGCESENPFMAFECCNSLCALKVFLPTAKIPLVAFKELLGLLCIGIKFFRLTYPDGISAHKEMVLVNSVLKSLA